MNSRHRMHLNRAANNPKCSEILTQRRERKRKLCACAVVFSIMVSFGFPGRYAELLGSGLGTMMQYLSLGLQLLVMLVASGDNGALSWKLIDLRPQYNAIYFMAIVFFVDSMLVTRYPSEQMVSCIRYCLTILYALWLVDYYEPEKILHLICVAQLIVLIFTAIFALIRPSSMFTQEQGSHDFAGIFQTKNNSAAELSVCILMQTAWLKIRREKNMPVPRVYFITLMVQIVLLVLCNSKGALFCAAVPAIYLIWMEKKYRLPLGVVYVVGSVLFLVVALTVLPILEPLLNAIGKDASLTGRIPMWNQVIAVMTQHNTFTGYGFAMFWRDRKAVALIHSAFSQYSFMGTMTTGAHNVLMEFWLNIGLIGIAAYFFAILASMNRVQQLKRERYILSAAYILWFMMSGWTERSISTFECQTLFLFIAMGTACNKEPIKPRRIGAVGKYEQS